MFHSIEWVQNLAFNTNIMFHTYNLAAVIVNDLKDKITNLPIYNTDVSFWALKLFLIIVLFIHLKDRTFFLMVTDTNSPCTMWKYILAFTNSVNWAEFLFTRVNIFTIKKFPVYENAKVQSNRKRLAAALQLETIQYQWNCSNDRQNNSTRQKDYRFWVKHTSALKKAP